MKNCTGCKHADWSRTKAGKLSSSGKGICNYPYRMPPLPAAVEFFRAPVLTVGHINRRVDLPGHCTYWARKETP